MKSLPTACILAAVLCLCAGQAFAQMEFGVGAKLGVNFGSASLTPDVSQKFGAGVTQGGRTGFMVGAAVELGFSKMYYIALEPTYCGKGYSVSAGANNETFAANELNLPVLFRVKFMKGTIRPYAFVGPDFSIVMSSSVSGTVNGQTFDQDLKSVTTSTDFAIDFGGGAEYNVTPKFGITFDVRYSLGLANVENPPANQVQSTTTSSTKLSGFQILAGVMYHIN